MISVTNTNLGSFDQTDRAQVPGIMDVFPLVLYFLDQQSCTLD